MIGLSIMTTARPLGKQADLQQMVGDSEGIAELRVSIELAAWSDATVLLSGESGAGKTLTAGLIHHRSSRALAPLALIKPARMSSVGFASDLATLAPGGTIVIDLVGHLTPPMQGVLLRHLEWCIEAGAMQSRGEAPARLIVATRRDLFADVCAGRFREDLYYRLNQIHLAVMPLRSRMVDVVPTAEHFLRTSRAGLDSNLLTPAVADALAAHSWPGNVRELKRVMHRISDGTRHATVRIGDLRFALRDSEQKASSQPSVVDS